MRFFLLTLILCNTLCANNRTFFQDNGYLWIKDFFTEEEVAALSSWTDSIDKASRDLLQCHETSGRPLKEFIQRLPDVPIVVPERDKPTLACRAEDFVAACPKIYFFINRKVANFISEVAGERYILFKDKINFKWPGGGAFLPHQDFPAYEFLGPREHITAMVAIDRATEENGCLKVAQNWCKTFANDPEFDPQTLEEGKVVFPYIIGGKEHGAIEPRFTDRMDWLSLLVSPRDLVIFSSYIPHYSEVNRTDAPRRAYFFTFNALREGEHRTAYYEAKRCDPDKPMFHIGTPTKATNK